MKAPAIEHFAAANVEQKQAREQQERQDGSAEGGDLQTGRVSDFANKASDFARKELDSLFRP